MATYYKYAERDADSQINWYEVGKSLSDMLAETNRVREEKKDALAKSQRETMQYLAETPNGEHKGARASILDYANNASNRMRIADQLMRSGQMSVKDYTIFRQNINDNTNLAFNANKAYQENYADVMQGLRDKKYSGLLGDNYEEVEGFGNWNNIGWEIAPDGTVMAGKMKEETIDGKKVRTLDRSEGSLRSMDYLNQAILSKIETYDYESQIKNFTDQLGENKEVLQFIKGTIGKQGQIETRKFIGSRKDIDEQTKQVIYDFLDSEDAKVKEIVGRDIDAARILRDSAVFAPNGEQYVSTTDAKLAKTAPHYILKTVDPETGGFTFKPTKEQYEQAQKFVRDQMRAQYDKIVEKDIVSQAQLQETAEAKAKAAAKYTPEQRAQELMEQDAENFAINLSNILTGTDEQSAQGIAYMRSRGADLEKNPPGKPAGVYVRTPQGLVAFESKGGTESAARGLAGALITATKSKFPEDMVVNKAKSRLGKTFNTTYKGTGATVDIETVTTQRVKAATKPSLFTNQNSKATKKALERELGKIPGISIVAEGGGALKGNEITITKPGAPTLIINSNESGTVAENQAKDLEKWLNDNLTQQDKEALSGVKTKGELD